MNPNGKFLNRNDCILLLVDIQKSMLDLCARADRIPFNASALLDAAGVFGIPVLCSVHNSERLGGFIPELTGQIPDFCFIDKMEFNCFENRSIAEAVLKTGRKTVLLAGIETHVCIFHTGVGALNLGYQVHVASDCVASRSVLNLETGLRRLDRAGAVISSTEMIIFELLNRAGTDEFRSLLPLLKKF